MSMNEFGNIFLNILVSSILWNFGIRDIAKGMCRTHTVHVSAFVVLKIRTFSVEYDDMTAMSAIDVGGAE